ncbi:MAG: LPS assembly lipoprotein LptE [Alphaproteobacteria bacterium]
MRWRETAFLLPILLLLGACGWRPVYAEREDSTGVSDQMAAVKLEPISYTGQQGPNLFRLGQELHNALLNRINPDGKPGKPVYAMRVVLAESELDMAIDPSGLSQRSSVTETANYSLVSLADGKTVMSGSSFGINSFGNVTNAYATVSGRNDARQRAITYVADDIAARLALYFRRPPSAEK